MFSLSSVHSLSASASYCVMRDPVLHESIVVSGRMIQLEAETSRDFRHYSPGTPLPHDYVRLECGGFSLAIWRDPSRPELNLAREPVPEAVSSRPGAPEVLAAEDRAADRELAEELAEPDPRESAPYADPTVICDPDRWAYFMTLAARRFAHSIFPSNPPLV